MTAQQFINEYLTSLGHVTVILVEALTAPKFEYVGLQWRSYKSQQQGLRIIECRQLGLKLIQQNPNKSSKWAAKERKNPGSVFQVLVNGEYVGVIENCAYQPYAR